MNSVRGSPGQILIYFYSTFYWKWKGITEFVCGSPGKNLIDFYSNCNWEWMEIGLGQPGTEPDWFLFNFQFEMKNIACNSTLQNLIDFYFNFNVWNWRKSAYSPGPNLVNFMQISVENQRELIWAAQYRIWLIDIQIPFEKDRKLVGGSSTQNLFDFYYNLYWK